MIQNKILYISVERKQDCNPRYAKKVLLHLPKPVKFVHIARSPDITWQDLQRYKSVLAWSVNKERGSKV